jgi:hypothetical protein
MLSLKQQVSKQLVSESRWIKVYDALSSSRMPVFSIRLNDGDGIDVVKRRIASSLTRDGRLTRPEDVILYRNNGRNCDMRPLQEWDDGVYRVCYLLEQARHRLPAVSQKSSKAFREQLQQDHARPDIERGPSLPVILPPQKLQRLVPTVISRIEQLKRQQLERDQIVSNSSAPPPPPFDPPALMRSYADAPSETSQPPPPFDPPALMRSYADAPLQVSQLQNSIPDRNPAIENAWNAPGDLFHDMLNSFHDHQIYFIVHDHQLYQVVLSSKNVIKSIAKM